MTNRSQSARRLATAVVAAVAISGGLLLVAGGLSACGPIVYVNQVTLKASSSVEAAKAVDADKYAPYWYTLAVEYLHKSREEASYADFQAATRFGRKSDQAATKAREESLRRTRSGEGPPVSPTASPPASTPKGGDKTAPDAATDGEDEENPDLSGKTGGGEQ